MLTATLFDIVRGSYVDGPGIRTIVFFKGCNLRCAWCHNPESQESARQMLFYANKCTGCGKCKQKCPNALASCDFCGKCTVFCPHDAREICGGEYTVQQVLSEVLKDKVFYLTSGGGVTFSGGECMLQLDFLEAVLKACRENGIHTAVDTAGCVAYAAFARISPYTDLFLYDVKCADGQKHKAYTGVDNARILENLAHLLRSGARVWVRIPVIPGVNDSEQEMLAIRRIFDAAGKPERVELLPYHAMGEHKYAALGRSVTAFAVPQEARLAALRAVFE